MLPKPRFSVVSMAALAALLSGTACSDSPAPPPTQPVPPTGPPTTPAPPPPAAAVTTPPPISGGTLLVLRDGRTAVASDPDRDRIYVVDLDPEGVRATVMLPEPVAEPGRVVEDTDGRVHVALRGGRRVATIDPRDGRLLARRALCPAPRGLAFDAGQQAAARRLRRRRAGLDRAAGRGARPHAAARSRPARRAGPGRQAPGHHLPQGRAAGGRRRRASIERLPARVAPGPLQRLRRRGIPGHASPASRAPPATGWPPGGRLAPGAGPRARPR